MNLASISDNLPSELQTYIKDRSPDSPYYKDVLCGLLSDKEKADHSYKARLYLAAIANRASFFQTCANKLSSNDLGFTDPINPASYLNERIPIDASNVKIQKDYLSEQIAGLPVEQSINEQLFTGVCYALQKKEKLRDAGSGDACEILANILSHGPYYYTPGQLRSDTVLEPSAVYMVLQGELLKDKNQNENGKQRNGWSELLSYTRHYQISDDKWTDSEDFEKLNPNGTITFKNKNSSEYVLVGVLVATGGHCTDNNLKFKTDSNGNLEFAGWIHHECLGQTPAVLNLIKKDSGTEKPKLTVQDFLTRYSSQVRNAARGGLILKFVPKTEVETYSNYYGCQNNNEGQN